LNRNGKFNARKALQYYEHDKHISRGKLEVHHYQAKFDEYFCENQMDATVAERQLNWFTVDTTYFDALHIVTVMMHDKALTYLERRDQELCNSTKPADTDSITYHPWAVMASDNPAATFEAIESVLACIGQIVNQYCRIID